MTIYYTKAATGVRPTVLPDTAQPAPIVIDVEFSATAPAALDTYDLGEIPMHLKVFDWDLIFPDIDSGTVALAWSFGVLNTAGTDLDEVWGAALTAGQSTAIVRNTTSVAAQSVLTAAGPRKLGLKCTTAAGTWAGSGKVGQVVLLAKG